MGSLKAYGTLYVLLALLSALVIVGNAVFVHADRELMVAFLNVGQGDAIFIEAPSGNQLLIDGGPGKAVLRELGKVMSPQDHSIDVVLATHPDKDHIGGLPDVFERFTVGYFVETGAASDTGAYRVLLGILGEKEVRRVFVRRGTAIDLGGGAVFTVLYPDYDVSRLSDTNSGSIVGKLSYGEHGFMLTGDAPSSVEARLVALDGENLESEVLKLGHHGSRTSSSASFMSRVRPLAAVISAGLNNSYGHPHEEVLSILEKLNIPFFGTYENGTVIFASDGKQLTRSEK